MKKKENRRRKLEPQPSDVVEGHRRKNKRSTNRQKDLSSWRAYARRAAIAGDDTILWYLLLVITPFLWHLLLVIIPFYGICCL